MTHSFCRVLLVLVLLLFVLAFRRVTLVGYAFVLLLVGLLLGFGFAGAVFGTLSAASSGFAALATAATAGSVGASAFFMAAFGMGTLPAMFVMSTVGRFLSTDWRMRLQRLIPVGILLVGLLLIIRGLSLGVFLSPDLREALFTPGVCRYLPFVEPGG